VVSATDKKLFGSTIDFS